MTRLDAIRARLEAAAPGPEDIRALLAVVVAARSRGACTDHAQAACVEWCTGCQYEVASEKRLEDALSHLLEEE